MDARQDDQKQIDLDVKGSKKRGGPMTLTDFYEYLFGDKALIKFDKRIESDEARKKIILKKHEEYIREAFSSIDKLMHDKFLSLLSSIQTPGANALKEILYPQVKSLLPVNDQASKVKPDHQYDDEYVKFIFHQVNLKFQYFPVDDSQSENDFAMFFRACKLMGDFVECNNDPQNTLAIDLAYKMLVVFGAAHEKKQHPLANVESYLREHANKQSAHPIHDALTRSIPVNTPPLKDLNGWRKLIRIHGYRALEFFQQASDIEKILGKAPDTLDEAISISSQLSYKRASEYPKLAYFCRQYHIDEATFNKCLEIENNRKKSDNLPDVKINGADISKTCKGYHLVKLPIDDPRAYILGNITNCCQSIDGHSEQCVIDGITRMNNGFYVLLKQKRQSNTNTPPLIEGHINDESYDIVGQCYAWLSKNGNMVVDSWENLRPESDDQIVVPLLEKFAQEVTEKTENIVRVTIGTGGGSPDYFDFLDKRVSYPEVMLEGVQYGDSKMQALIYCNELKCLGILQAQGLLTHDTLQKLQDNKHLSDLLPSFLNLEKEIQTQQIFDFFLGNSQYAGDLVFILSDLHKINPALINKDNLKKIADVLSELYRIPALNNKNGIFQLVFTHIEHSSEILSALICMHSINPDLINNESLQLLGAHVEHSVDIASALMTMYRSSTDLINKESFQLLGAHVEHSREITRSLISLHRANPGLINKENLQLLDAHAEHSEKIANALCMLQRSPALINNITRSLLAKHVANIYSMVHQIESLFKLVSDNSQSHLYRLYRLFTRNPIDEIYTKIKKFLLGDSSVSFTNGEITALENVNSLSKYSDIFKSLPIRELLENESRNLKLI